MSRILLFYKYVPLKDPDAVMHWQRELCTRLGIKGRILLATEGINATVGGSVQACKEYKKAMKQYKPFANIDFKESEGASDHFPRLQVTVKKEIVHLGLDPQKYTAQQGGKHLNPKEAHELIAQQSKDLVIIDCRNKFETRIGTITGSIRPDTDHFREFPQYVDEHADEFKDKEVLMFCTGGIRCERASAYIKSKGTAKEVYQIKGGIHRYTEEYPDGFFRGKNYVFDGRIAMRINDDILGECDLCQTACDEYTNCINATCNKHFISCPGCLESYDNCCSSACKELVLQNKVHKRPLRLNHTNAANGTNVNQ